MAVGSPTERQKELQPTGARSSITFQENHRQSSDQDRYPDECRHRLRTLCVVTHAVICPDHHVALEVEPVGTAFGNYQNILRLLRRTPTPSDSGGRPDHDRHEVHSSRSRAGLVDGG